jgi:proteic killer suppression protein
VIRSFRCRDTLAVFSGGTPRRWAALARLAERKLMMLDAARSLMDLRIPPGNRLEALSGDRKGSHSIRVNDRYRICFRWEGENAFEVEIVDYH